MAMSKSIAQLRSEIERTGVLMQSASGKKYYDLRKHRFRMIKQLKMCQAYLNDKKQMETKNN